MSTADTILFLGLVALAYWTEEPRLQLMAGVVGIMAGLTAASLAPSPFVGVAVLGTGVYLRRRRRPWHRRLPSSASPSLAPASTW